MKQYSWFEIYRAALLELDSSKIPARLMLAREKLRQRMQIAGLDSDEQQAIVDALQNLHAVASREKNCSLRTGDRALTQR
jgi:hypothetical protein